MSEKVETFLNIMIWVVAIVATIRFLRCIVMSFQYDNSTLKVTDSLVGRTRTFARPWSFLAAVAAWIWICL